MNLQFSSSLLINAMYLDPLESVLMSYATQTIKHPKYHDMGRNVSRVKAIDIPL